MLLAWVELDPTVFPGGEADALLLAGFDLDRTVLTRGEADSLFLTPRVEFDAAVFTGARPGGPSKAPSPVGGLATETSSPSGFAPIRFAASAAGLASAASPVVGRIGWSPTNTNTFDAHLLTS